MSNMYNSLPTRLRDMVLKITRASLQIAIVNFKDNPDNLKKNDSLFPAYLSLDYVDDVD